MLMTRFRSLRTTRKGVTKILQIKLEHDSNQWNQTRGDDAIPHLVPGDGIPIPPIVVALLRGAHCTRIAACAIPELLVD